MYLSKFLFRHKKILSPHAEYLQRQCFLIQYDVPFLPYCFILCTEEKNQHLEQLQHFAIAEAQRLSMQYLAKENHFLMIYSGNDVRRRSNWHVHIFLIENRWQKAMVYQMLAVKNFALCFGMK